jgi:hypothetical protein
MSFVYGAFNNLVPFEGLLLADLTVFNVNQSGALVVSSITPVVGESGKYDMVIAAGSNSAETIRVSVSKDGFEMTPFTYLIP